MFFHFSREKDGCEKKWSNTDMTYGEVKDSQTARGGLRDWRFLWEPPRELTEIL